MPRKKATTKASQQSGDESQEMPTTEAPERSGNESTASTRTTRSQRPHIPESELLSLDELPGARRRRNKKTAVGPAPQPLNNPSTQEDDQDPSHDAVPSDEPNIPTTTQHDTNSASVDTLCPDPPVGFPKEDPGPGPPRSADQGTSAETATRSPKGLDFANPRSSASSYISSSSESEFQSDGSHASTVIKDSSAASDRSYAVDRWDFDRQAMPDSPGRIRHPIARGDEPFTSYNELQPRDDEEDEIMSDASAPPRVNIPQDLPDLPSLTPLPGFSMPYPLAAPARKNAALRKKRTAPTQSSPREEKRTYLSASDHETRTTAREASSKASRAEEMAQKAAIESRKQLQVLADWERKSSEKGEEWDSQRKVLRDLATRVQEQEDGITQILGQTSACMDSILQLQLKSATFEKTVGEGLRDSSTIMTRLASRADRHEEVIQKVASSIDGIVTNVSGLRDIVDREFRRTAEEAAAQKLQLQQLVENQERLRLTQLAQADEWIARHRFSQSQDQEAERARSDLVARIDSLAREREAAESLYRRELEDQKIKQHQLATRQDDLTSKLSPPGDTTDAGTSPIKLPTYAKALSPTATPKSEPIVNAEEVPSSVLQTPTRPQQHPALAALEDSLSRTRANRLASGSLPYSSSAPTTPTTGHNRERLPDIIFAKGGFLHSPHKGLDVKSISDVKIISQEPKVPQSHELRNPIAFPSSVSQPSPNQFAMPPRLWLIGHLAQKFYVEEGHVFADVRSTASPNAIYDEHLAPDLPRARNGRWVVREEPHPRWELIPFEELEDDSIPAPHPPSHHESDASWRGKQGRKKGYSNHRDKDSSRRREDDDDRDNRRGRSRKRRSPSRDAHHRHRSKSRSRSRDHRHHSRSHSGHYRSRSRSRSRSKSRSRNRRPIVKVPEGLLPKFDPKTGPTQRFCNAVLGIRNIYGERSVLLAIPTCLAGDARDWFETHKGGLAHMTSVDEWLYELKREFPVNFPEARKEALARRYEPGKDESFSSYYYAKVNLLETANPEISSREILTDVWNGLPPEFMSILDEDRVLAASSTSKARRYLAGKDRVFRLTWAEKNKRAEQRRRERNDSRERRRKDKRSREREFKPPQPRPSNNNRPSSKRPSAQSNDKWGKKYPIPAELPSDKIKNDARGRPVKRPCRFCGKADHWDRDCPRKPQSFSVQYSLDQLEFSDFEGEMEQGIPSDDEDRIAKEEIDYFKETASSSMHVVTSYTTESFHPPDDTIRLPRAEDYPVLELPVPNVVGTGISYLSARPCPVKCWLGIEPSGNNPLTPGVLDTGGPNLIEKSLIPPEYTIRRAPLSPNFTGINDQNATRSLGFVVMPVYLPNAAAMSGDSGFGRVLMIHVEFQVLDRCQAGYLIGRDAIKAYRMIIDEDSSSIIFPQFKPRFRVPITEGPKYSPSRKSNKIYAAATASVAPDSETWVPIRFDPAEDARASMIVFPAQHPGRLDGTYPAVAHCLISNDTTHLVVLNTTSRPAIIEKDQVIATFNVVDYHTPAASFNIFALSNFLSTDATTTFPPMFRVETPPPHRGSTLPAIPLPASHAKSPYWTMDSDETFDVNVIQRTDTGEEMTPEWKRMADAEVMDNPPRVEPKSSSDQTPSIDPFGLQDEFREDRPILEPSATYQYSDQEADDLDWDISPKLNRKQRRVIMSMLRKHLKVFSGKDGRLGKLPSEFDMDVDVANDGKDIKLQQPYRTSPLKRRLIKEAVSKLLDLGVIEPSRSDIASPVVVVQQKGKARFCLDLREVNSQVKADRYMIPRQDNIFASLSGSLFFSTLDCNKGYHQIGLTPRSRRFFAFITEDGTFHYLRVPFGAKTAPAHFQRTMDRILSKYRCDFALAYLDDIVIYSRTFEQHLLHISLVLQALQDVGMTLEHKKCHFAYDSIQLLGHRISRFGLATLSEKVAAITSLPFPKTLRQAQESIGLFNYYRIFIPHFSWLAAPLYNGLRTSTRESKDDKEFASLDPKQKAKARGRYSFPATRETQAAFNSLKRALTRAPVLAFPNYGKKFILYTDACYVGIAGALHQIQSDGKEHPIAFISRQLKDAETRYTATEIECLACVWCLDKFSHYLDGSSFDLYTDHAALKWIWSLKPDVNARLFRWSLQLSPLRDKINIIHRPGRFHANVDTLSRQPTPASNVPTTATNVPTFATATASSIPINAPDATDAYSITHITISERWKEDLWESYGKDRFFRRVLVDLGRHLGDEKRRIEKEKEIIMRLGEESSRLGKEFAQGEGGRAKSKGLRDGKGPKESEKEEIEEGKPGDGTYVALAAATAEKERDLELTSAEKGSSAERDLSSAENGTSAELDLIETMGVSAEKGSSAETGVSIERRKDVTATLMGSRVDLNLNLNLNRKDDLGRKDVLGRKESGRKELTEGEEGAELTRLENWKELKDLTHAITDGTFTLLDRAIYFEEKDGRRRLCIPASMESTILRLNHDATGHQGVRRTYLSISPRFYFPRMAKKVRRYVNECRICQISKPSHEPPAGKLFPIRTDEPFHTISIDFVTGLPLSEDGHDAFLSVTDKFTKCIHLIPCHTTTTAEETARLYLRFCYPTMGLPVKIISDRDARFTLHFWSTLTALLDVDLGLTAAYHPSADGQAERSNQTVELGLRCFLGAEPEKYHRWTLYLPIFEYEYNALPQESTGLSPNELRFAMPLRGIPDVINPPISTSAVAEEFVDDLRNRRDEARDAIRLAQRKQKKYFDKGRTDRTFQPGDLVLLRYKKFGDKVGYRPPYQHAHKLGPVATPIRIKERLSPVSYRLDLPATSQIHDVVSLIHLKRYAGKGDDVRPLPVTVDGHEEFEVEEICGERVTDGVTKFLVKWKGYDLNERTWEPLENLAEAQDKLLEWKNSRPDPEARTKARSTKRSIAAPTRRSARLAAYTVARPYSSPSSDSRSLFAFSSPSSGSPFAAESSE